MATSLIWITNKAGKFLVKRFLSRRFLSRRFLSRFDFFWEEDHFKLWKDFFQEIARPEVSEQILDIWPSLLVCHYHLAATHQAFIFSLYYIPPSALHRQSILESITINISQRPQSFAKVTAKAIFRLQRWPFESGPKKYQHLTQHTLQICCL